MRLSKDQEREKKGRGFSQLVVDTLLCNLASL